MNTCLLTHLFTCLLAYLKYSLANLFSLLTHLLICSVDYLLTLLTVLIIHVKQKTYVNLLCWHTDLLFYSILNLSHLLTYSLQFWKLNIYCKLTNFSWITNCFELGIILITFTSGHLNTCLLNHLLTCLMACILTYWLANLLTHLLIFSMNPLLSCSLYLLHLLYLLIYLLTYIITHICYLTTHLLTRVKSPTFSSL